MKVVTSSEMRQIDEKANAGGLSTATMMENAGRAVAEEIGRRIETKGQEILVLVGPGNNGGDGLVAARHLHDSGAKVNLYLWKRKITGDENFALTQKRGIPFLRARDDPDFTGLRHLLSKAQLIIDALLGTGVSRPITGTLKGLLDTVREGLKEKPTFLVALDLPTGLDCDTGAVDPATIPAHLTVTLAFPKRGLFLFPGAAYIGELVVADIGIPEPLAQEIETDLATAEMVAQILPPRPLNAHKGTFGKALIVAGSVNYTGAAYLASAAATRVGTGLVTLALAENLHPILASKLLEVTFLLLPHDLGALVPDALPLLAESLPDYDALLLGPGLGKEDQTVDFVHRLLGLHAAGVRRHIGFMTGEEREELAPLELPPLVVDADGLNALAQAPKWWKSLPGPAILTPHPGEMARLLDSSVKEIEEDRVGTVVRAAQKWGQVVVLKGAHSLVAAPDGRLTISPFANPGLATAGTGDVLAGAIVGFLAQGLLPYQAAIAGVFLHGLAGEMARQEVGETGMVAGDLLPLLPQAIRSLK